MASSVAEVERLAEEKLSKTENFPAIWNFINLATGEGQTYNESKRAFKRWRFQPRILSAKPNRSLWTTVLGQPISMPIGIAPSVSSSFLHSDGEANFGRAAARAQTLMVLSSVSDFPIEDFIARVPPDGLYWAQIYLFKDKRNTLHIVRNAERAGFKALVVTVDSPVEHKSTSKSQYLGYGDLRFPTLAANIRFLAGEERVFSEQRPSVNELWAPGSPCHSEPFCCANWEDLAWLKGQTKLPIVLKGVLSADSARRAAAFGVSGIIVSAHGGRQLDGCPAPLDALPDIVDAVKDSDVEVYMDGGVRTGNDVVKALALGARAVFIGRPALYGLAYDGEDGVHQVLKILDNELSICMALCGCSTIQEIDRSIVKHETEFHPKL